MPSFAGANAAGAHVGRTAAACGKSPATKPLFIHAAPGPPTGLPHEWTCCLSYETCHHIPHWAAVRQLRERRVFVESCDSAPASHNTAPHQEAPPDPCPYAGARDMHFCEADAAGLVGAMSRSTGISYRRRCRERPPVRAMICLLLSQDQAEPDRSRAAHLSSARIARSITDAISACPQTLIGRVSGVDHAGPVRAAGFDEGVFARIFPQIDLAFHRPMANICVFLP